MDAIVAPGRPSRPIPPHPAPFRLVRVCGGALALGQAPIDTIPPPPPPTPPPHPPTPPPRPIRVGGGGGGCPRRRPGHDGHHRRRHTRHTRHTRDKPWIHAEPVANSAAKVRN